MAPYSIDLRQKILSAWENKEGTQRELAERFKVSLSFIRDFLRRYRETSEITAKPQGGDRRSKIQGENQELLKIRFNNGSILKCTPYHKFYIRSTSNHEQVVEAKDLSPGMKLIQCDFPVIYDGLNDFKAPYEHGLFSADQRYFPEYFKHFKDDGQEFKFNSFPPINYNLDIKLKWLSGFFDGSNVKLRQDVIYIENINIDNKFLLLVKNLLQTIGINSVATTNSIVMFSSDVKNIVK